MNKMPNKLSSGGTSFYCKLKVPVVIDLQATAKVVRH